MIVMSVLVAWFLIVLGAGTAGVFDSGPGRPPLPLLLAVVGPPLLFGLAYRSSRAVRGSPCASICACSRPFRPGA